MAYVIADRVKETSTTTGTSNLSLAGAVTGYQAFSAVCSNNDVCWYCATLQGGTEWEVGLGTWVTGNTLNRTAGNVLAGSAGAGTLVTFSAGTKDVFITAPANRAFVLTNELAAVLPDTTDPTAPTSGLLIYSRAVAGRRVPRFLGPSGLDSAVQPALWANAVTMWLPGTGTTASIAFGVSWTVSATQAHPTIANTNVMTRIKRATYTTTTTAGNTSGVRTTAPVVIRNSGFFFAARFGILTYTSTMQVIVGLAAASGALAGEPSAVNDSVAMTKDSGETTWQVMTRDTSAASKTSTGRTTAAAADAEVFDFYAFCKPADSKITVRVVDVATGTVVLTDTEKSSNLPTNTTALYAHAEFRNSAGGAGSAVAGFLSKIYIETDL